MNDPLYTYSLCIALPLMTFFAIYFLAGRTPDKEIFKTYLTSRRLMGIALLLLTANYSVHFFFGIRFINVNAAILMNLVTYFLCYWLFSSAMMMLLDRHYVSRRRFATHLILWVAFSVFAWIVLLLLPNGIAQTTGLTALAAILISYGLILSYRLVAAYRRAVKLFDDTHSDDLGAYIRWLSIFTFWAVTFGVGCGLLTFLPDKYIFIWILSSVPFYIYLFCSYQNYLLFYEQVECAFESEQTSDSDAASSADDVAPSSPAYYAEIAERIDAWVKADGYIQPRLTIKELADILLTNRTYLSYYIDTVLHTTYREWITGLRMQYAKQQMALLPEKKLTTISEEAGFLSPSHFMKAFKEREGCSPAKWRKQQIDSKP